MHDLIITGLSEAICSLAFEPNARLINGIAFRHTLTYRVHLIFVQVSAFDDPF